MADSPGARLVQEWNAYLHEQGGYVGPTYRDDLARRIDAALAECTEAAYADARSELEQMAGERDEFKAKLAEREAQITQLRDAALALLAVCDCVGDDEDPKYGVPKKALRAAIHALGPKT